MIFNPLMLRKAGVVEMLEAIYHRRSVRRFLPEALTEETVTALLKAACAAPSAHHLRPWRFVVVDSQEKMRGMLDIHSHMEMLRTAPTAIIVCGDSTVSPDFWPDDCAAATENMVIAAEILGLGSFWCAVYPRVERMEEFVQLFSLPEGIKPYSVLAVGKPAEPKIQAERFKQELIHRNQW